jgi:excisionase family DNA binding protein
MRLEAALQAVPGEPASSPTASVLDELMTAEEMAGVLQMRVSTIQGYARRGLLPSVKVGRHRRFIRSDVEAAILRLCGSG